MRVSDKGQITIPKYLRDQAGIGPNSEITISLEGNRLILELVDSPQKVADRMRLERFMAALSRLEGTGDPAIGAEDVMRETRDR